MEIFTINEHGAYMIIKPDKDTWISLGLDAGRRKINDELKRLEEEVDYWKRHGEKSESDATRYAVELFELRYKSEELEKENKQLKKHARDFFYSPYPLQPGEVVIKNPHKMQINPACCPLIEELKGLRWKDEITFDQFKAWAKPIEPEIKASDFPLLAVVEKDGEKYIGFRDQANSQWDKLTKVYYWDKYNKLQETELWKREVHGCSDVQLNAEIKVTKTTMGELKVGDNWLPEHYPEGNRDAVFQYHYVVALNQNNMWYGYIKDDKEESFLYSLRLYDDRQHDKPHDPRQNKVYKFELK